MILARLADTARIASTYPGLASAFAALGRTDLAALADGRHDLDGDRLFLLVARNVGRGREASPLEAHRRYVDVQYVVSGRDEIGWLPTFHCRSPRSSYDEARDITFYDDSPSNWVVLDAGMLAVFFPEDAHAPLGGTGPVHKVVVKLVVA